MAGLLRQCLRHTPKALPRSLALGYWHKHVLHVPSQAACAGAGRNLSGPGRLDKGVVRGHSIMPSQPAVDEGWDALLGSFSNLLGEVDEAGVVTLTLNRPKQLNALNSELMGELVAACQYLDRKHPSARVIIVTGSGSKAFAAGADIKEMSSVTYSEAYNKGLLDGWETLRTIRKPIIAAVNGFALGGGCELAMLADIIIAADSASFGQPEINLGVLPGMGGTQRLTRAVGKSRAMELVLTGDRLSAAEAVSLGLASRAVPAAELMETTQKLARRIAAASLPVAAKAKECVNQAYEMTLAEGVRFEKREFWSCFALADQKEGMAAFIEKRTPVFGDS
ncbi:hypothetical protein ACKKBG_A34175 [Auxenochlorella protothecoides x Auxenochlorella symbiontica]